MLRVVGHRRECNSEDHFQCLRTGEARFEERINSFDGRIAPVFDERARVRTKRVCTRIERGGLRADRFACGDGHAGFPGHSSVKRGAPLALVLNGIHH